jgi:hypothetical protein
LNEIVAVTGLHRKAAIRLLGRTPAPRPQPGPGGRPRMYGPEVAAAAEVLWQASGRIGAHRRQPFIPELLERLVVWGELTVRPPVEKLLRQISRPTLARVLEPARAQYPQRGATITHRAIGYGTRSRSARSPIGTTFGPASWKSIWARIVGAALAASSPKAAFAQLQRVYGVVRLHINFFQPVQKLVTKTRAGARTHRVYDRAQTPYQRLCAAGVLAPAKRAALERLYNRLNPLQLRRDLAAALERLWPLAAPDPHRGQGNSEIATPLTEVLAGRLIAMAPVTLSFESTRTGG